MPLAPETRRKKLHRLKADYTLSVEDIARYCAVTRWAAESWLRRPDNRSARYIPAAKLELLQMKLAAIAPAAATA